MRLARRPVARTSAQILCRAAAAVAAVAACCCGRFQPALTPATVEAPAPPLPSDQEPAPPPVVRSELLRVLREEPEGALWLDGDALRRSVFQPALSPVIAEWFAARSPEVARLCPGNPLEAVRELVLGDTPGGRKITAARLDRPAAEWEPCVGALAAELAGTAIELRSVDDLMIAGESAELLDEVLDRVRGGGPLPNSVARLQQRARGALLVAQGPEFDIVLRTGPADIDLQGLFKASSAEAAREMLLEAREDTARLIRTRRAGGVELSEALCSYLSEHLSLGLEGDALRASVRGPFGTPLAGEVVRAIQRGVQRDLVFQRTVEARNDLHAIAERIRTTVNSQQPAPLLLPVSTPLTPARVPGAAGYVATDADFGHPTWRAIGYSKAGLMRYSYEISTSRDRKRAIVRARGDLDGDGIESRFELTVSVDTTSGISAANVQYPMQETNPEE